MLGRGKEKNKRNKEKKEGGGIDKYGYETKGSYHELAFTMSELPGM